jgi:hypothetical protein
MTVTFNSVELYHASPLDRDTAVRSAERILLNGRSKIVPAANAGTRFRFTCMGSLAQMDAITALVGAAYTLDVGGTQYTNCHILGTPKTREMPGSPGNYTLSLEFVQDTSV